jgi:pyruvate dehydrogenase E2 component (dihydrolipoamide acetyltransferase)
VDTEIPSPASGILRGISVDEDETVAVGAQLAVIDDGASGDAAPGADDSASAAPAEAAEPAPAQADSAQADSAQADSAQGDSAQADSAQHDSEQPDSAEPDSGQNDSGRPAAAQAEQAPASSDGWSPQGSQPNYAPPAQSSPAASPGHPGSSAPSTPAYAPPPAYGQPQSPAAQVPAQGQPAAEESGPAAPAAAEAEEYPPPTPLPGAGDAPYVTPLVRKLAAEHAVNLESVTGTGVGGRIRKQDVIEAARAQRAAQPPTPAQPAQPSQPAQPAAEAQAPQPAQPQPQPPQQARPAQATQRPAVVPSSLRGTTQRMSRPRQVIAQRMVESLHVSAQLTTVVEADVTAIARLRDQARQDFEAREGVKLSFLPFFALAAVEALKVHPKLNAVIDADQVTYHDAEHLGVAVDTERGLMVPVIHNAGDLNIGGLARKISDLASRTRSSQVGPDELAGGTFTLTNTGSRGALFDTPIINQPQVAILGTGTVVKRPVVVTDPALGEVIAVRSMVYLALTYDHRLVDGADAARFLTTVKSRLEEGAFEAELGL